MRINFQASEITEVIASSIWIAGVSVTSFLFSYNIFRGHYGEIVNEVYDAIPLNEIGRQLCTQQFKSGNAKAIKACQDVTQRQYISLYDGPFLGVNDKAFSPAHELIKTDALASYACTSLIVIATTHLFICNLKKEWYSDKVRLFLTMIITITGLLTLNTLLPSIAVNQTNWCSNYAYTDACITRCNQALDIHRNHELGEYGYLFALHEPISSGFISTLFILITHLPFYLNRTHFFDTAIDTITELFSNIGTLFLSCMIHIRQGCNHLRHSPNISSTLFGNNTSELSVICPITREQMRDPVIIVETSNTYEREAIEQWLETHNTDPLSGVELADKKIIPNRALKDAIESLSMLNKVVTTTV